MSSFVSSSTISSKKEFPYKTSFKSALFKDSEALYNLEKISYPVDEAATFEKIQYRITHANDYFYVLKIDDDAHPHQHGKILGFVNGTCVNEDTIHHDSMAHHVENGPTLVIHSVTTHPDYRRQGLASKMLRDYVNLIQARTGRSDTVVTLTDETTKTTSEATPLPKISRVLLLSKSYLLPFYLMNGFQFIRVSPVSHGKETWIELGTNLEETNQWVVDAFTAVPFAGNPAAVILKHKEPEWMQKVAMENNYAETSFLERIYQNTFKIRWFSPAKEIDLCGHATLAAAHVLYEQAIVPADLDIHFQTLTAGELVAHKNLTDGMIELNFPATPVTEIMFSESEKAQFLAAFGLDETAIVFTSKSIYDLMVELTPEAFNSISAINFSLLEKFGGRGVLVTTIGGKRSAANTNPRYANYDFVSRGFFPLCAVNEDPVTGSAHCAIAPYWFNKFGIELRPNERSTTLDAYQASERGGHIKISLFNDRVILGGKAITTMTAKVLV